MYSPPIDPIKEAKKRGIKVFEFDGEGVLNGMIAQVEGETFISVEKNLREDKKNVVCFHELWHYVTDTIQAPAFPRIEHMANKAAREIAITEARLREVIQDIQDYSTLASIFWVTVRMVEIRCLELGM